MDNQKLTKTLSDVEVREVTAIFEEVAAKFEFAPYSADHNALAGLVMDLAANSGYRGEKLRLAADRFCQRLKGTE